jgi:hypothetical protein
MLGAKVKVFTDNRTMRAFVTMATSLVIAMLFVSCANRMSIERAQMLAGTWRTEQGVIVTISQTPGHGLAASIKTAPGFAVGPMAPGTYVLTEIEAQPDRTFRGDFLVPGDEKPIRLTIVFSGRDRLLMGSADKRVRGKVMIWTRVPRE